MGQLIRERDIIDGDLDVVQPPLPLRDPPAHEPAPAEAAGHRIHLGDKR